MKTQNRKILSVKNFDDTVFVSLEPADRLNILNADQVEKELIQVIQNGEKTILLDFSKMKFIDSSGFQALLSVHIDARLKGVKFVIVNVNEEINYLLKLVDLDNIFEISVKSDFNPTKLKKAS